MNNKPLVTIYLVRHGESEANIHGNKPFAFHKQWGKGQSPLTKNGKNQAQKRANSLRHIHFHAAFSSDVTRAIQTAEIIALEHNLAVQMTNKIRERNFFGYFETQHEKGKLKMHIEEEMKKTLQKLDEKGKMAYKHGEGMESPEEAASRLLRFLREIAVSYIGKNILVVNHSNNMRSLLTHLGYAKFDELPSGTIDNTGYIILESDGIDFFIRDTQGINKQQGTIRIL